MRITEWVTVLMVLMLSVVSFAAAEDALVDTQASADTSASLEATVDAEVEVEAEAQAGITPDSAFYGLENAWDNLGLAFTFDKAKRAEKSLALARERLYEVKKMLEEGKLEQAEKARLRYDKLIEKSKEAIDEVESDGNTEKARAALERIVMMQNNAEEHFDRLAAVKEKILLRLGENITAEQKAAIDAFLDRLENKSLEVEQRLEQKKETVKVKYKLLSGASDEDVDELEVELEDETGLWDDRRERAKNEILRTRLAVIKAKEKIRQNSDDSDSETDEETELETEIEIAEEDLDDLNNETRFRARYKEAIETARLIREYGNEIASIATTIGDARRNGTWNETKGMLRTAIVERKELRDDLLRQRLELRERLETGEGSRAEIKMKVEARNDEMRERIEIRIRDRQNKDGNDDDVFACTADAKVCPDGSAVGRAGRNCEFRACPGEPGFEDGNSGSDDESDDSGVDSVDDLDDLLDDSEDDDSEDDDSGNGVSNSGSGSLR